MCCHYTINTTMFGAPRRNRTSLPPASNPADNPIWGKLVREFAAPFPGNPVQASVPRQHHRQQRVSYPTGPTYVAFAKTGHTGPARFSSTILLSVALVSCDSPWGFYPSYARALTLSPVCLRGEGFFLQKLGDVYGIRTREVLRDREVP